MRSNETNSSDLRLGPLRPIPILIALAVLILAGLLQPAAASAQGSDGICLDWPMGRSVGGQVVPGYGIEVYQNYANRAHPRFGPRPHAGVDLRYSDGINAYQPVYAAADGVVVYAAYLDYPGSVVVVRHDLPGGGALYTQYGHLHQYFYGVGASISRGAQIGTIYNEPGNSHLHFEVRTFHYDPINGSAAGPGYGSNHLEPWQQGWLDPVQQVFTHRPGFPGTVIFDTGRNVLSSPTSSGGYLSYLPAGSQVTVEAAAPDSTGSGHWWYRVRYSGSSVGYANVFLPAYYSSGIYAGEVPRSCGGNGAEILTSQSSIPSSLSPGVATPVTVRVRNSGSTTWTADWFRLGAISSNGVAWSGFQCGGYSPTPPNSRVYLCHDVAPGATYDFHFSITAPGGVSQTTLAVDMVQDGVAFFEQPASWNLPVSGGGGTPVYLAVDNADMETQVTSQYNGILNWGPSGAWAHHHVHSAAGNSGLGSRFGYYSAGTSETVGQVLGFRFEANRIYTFKSYAIGGGNKTGRIPYQIGYAAIDGNLGSFVELARNVVDVSGNQSWTLTPGVSYTTGSSGPELGRQIILRFGSGAQGGASDIWFDHISLSRQ